LYIQTYEFFAGMTCSGCSNAITRVVNKVPGTVDIVCNVDTKQVLVTSTQADETAILAKMAKWGRAADKEVRYVGVYSA
jgi:copper chaperone